MKKLLVLFTVMVAVFGFSTGAFAAWGDPICESCKGCDLGNIPCAGEQDTCGDFDYDFRSGYCGFGDYDNCRAIFNICNCEDPTDFDAGETIGIRMTVLVDGAPGENGAYWSLGASAAVDFNAYNSAAAACAGTVQDRTFGAGEFLRYSDGVIIPGGSLIGDPTCTVPPAAQATVILTDEAAGYTITAQDALDKMSHWWIDIAPIRIDPAVVQSGQVISVMIELLNQESGGICADCTPVCECIIDVAIVCCDTATTYSMTFPYVLPGEAGWNTGIVVSNLSAGTCHAVVPANMVATFTLTDKTGAQFTYEKSDFTTAVWSGWLNDMLPEFDGTPEIGPGWLKVTTNFTVDGYEFLTDGIFGAGTLPRK